MPIRDEVLLARDELACKTVPAAYFSHNFLDNVACWAPRKRSHFE